MDKKRTFFVRLAVFAAVIALSVLMMVIGRGHTIIIENSTFEYEGKTYEAAYKIVAYDKNGERFAKLSKRERGKTTCMGQSYAFTVDITAEKDKESKREIISIDIPYNLDGVIINLPAYMAGLPQEVYMTEYVIAAEPEEDSSSVPAEDQAFDPNAIIM